MKQRLFTRNFTLLVLGQAASLFGNFILRLALSMYVLEATGSAAMFAGILSVALIPTILLSPFGGILADRANRRNIMVALDLLTGISVSGAAALLHESNALAVISALLVILSVLGAFETPTVQACVPQMQEGENIVRGNAVISQVASVAYFTGPMLGGVLYAAFGLGPVMWASAGFFFATALLECFIKLGLPGKPVGGMEPGNGRDEAAPGQANRPRLLSVIRADILDSVRFLSREQPGILKMLLLAALSRFFVMGIAVVGLPYLVRNVLALGAKHYGAAESALALAAILGSMGAGLLTGKLGTGRLWILLGAIGAFLIPAGFAFALPLPVMAVYSVSVAAFCGMQASVNIFSIFAVSLIQQRTPDRLLGKVMACVSTVTMCAQPIGQIVYGFLFDGLKDRVSLILLFTGLVVCGIGGGSGKLFQKLEAGS